MYIYIACAYAYLCVYMHVLHHVHTHFKHFQLSFLNVFKEMNVCVQNTVFLRRGYSFCFYSELGGHISKNLIGKSLEIPVNNLARPSFNVQRSRSLLFLAPTPTLQVIPCWKNRKLMYIKALDWFFGMFFFVLFCFFAA